MNLFAALDAAYAPYVMMITLAFLPNEIWRVLGPPDALAAVPSVFRAGALGASMVVFFLTKRRVLPAILVGEAIIVLAAWLSA